MNQKKPKKKKHKEGQKLKYRQCKICGTKFPVFNSTQTICGWKCALALAKKNKKKKYDRMLKDSGKTKDKLRTKADKLFQEIGKKLYPTSALSEQSTEVIHHYIYKSDSNNTRYSFNNAVPMTFNEHYNIHNGKHKGTLNAKASLWLNNKLKKVEEESKIDRKLTETYLKEVIAKLEKML